jgi:hypothetical protein
MPRRARHYSLFTPPLLSMSELVKTTLDHDSTDMLIDKWLEHRGGSAVCGRTATGGLGGDHINDAYHDWFREVRERKHNATQRANANAAAAAAGKGESVKRYPHQTIAWNKGVFVPENVFCRTVDTGRLIPLDRTWTTHVYHHHSMHERKLSMMPVVFTMVCVSLRCNNHVGFITSIYPYISFCFPHPTQDVRLT